MGASGHRGVRLPPARVAARVAPHEELQRVELRGPDLLRGLGLVPGVVHVAHLEHLRRLLRVVLDVAEALEAVARLEIGRGPALEACRRGPEPVRGGHRHIP